ncbi:MAG: hypothetical protein IKH11_02970 [Bacteroidales bacterium]|nr:hypothetical protein [Bacteroidales bacterium]
MDSVSTDAYSLDGLPIPIIGFDDWTGVQEEIKMGENKGKSSFIYYMTPRSNHMANAMSAYTDNLSTHDCLYYPILKWLYNGIAPVIKLNTIRGLARVDLCLVLLFERLFCKKKNLDYTFIAQGKNQVWFDAVYITHRCRYAIEVLDFEESTWGLYYYPTILIDWTIGVEEDGSFMGRDDGTGLYRTHRSIPIKKAVLYEYYSLLPCGYYVRIWSPHALTKQDAITYLDDYTNVTEEMNAIIKEFVFCNRSYHGL